MYITSWDTEDSEPRAEGEKIDSDNFSNYIYGGETDWTGVDGFDGCSALTSKPTVQ
jgi:hypothetical protein